jgi:hypothetical protein
VGLLPCASVASCVRVLEVIACPQAMTAVMAPKRELLSVWKFVGGNFLSAGDHTGRVQRLETQFRGGAIAGNL